MPKPPKLPQTSAAWAQIAALVDQEDDDFDVNRDDYVGPVEPRVFAAALLNLRDRIIALENQ